jgi:hypothetical protein
MCAPPSRGDWSHHDIDLQLAEWDRGRPHFSILPYEFESFEFVVVNLGAGKSGITLATKSGGKSAPVGSFKYIVPPFPSRLCSSELTLHLL